MFFSRKNVRVSVRDKKIVIETKSGINLYRFLINEKIIQNTLCDGSGQCGKCKIRFVGSNLPKPTYKESLILAKVNIEAGYRLACQHTVKKDIEIDTSELNASSSFIIPRQDYPKALKDPGEVKAAEVTIIEDEQKKETPKKIIDETESVSINNFKPAASKTRPHESHAEEGPSDGIFMIQQRNGVRYFCYSAAIDNIVAEGIVETREPLRDVIDNNLVPDFIHNVLKIKDIDRVLMLIEERNNYSTENALDMIKYFEFEVGTLLCEVIMPYEGNQNVARFFRLLNADRGNKIMFSLDMLDRVHYLTDKLVTDMRFPDLSRANMVSLNKKGSNQITDFDDDLNFSAIETKGQTPDGVSFVAILKFIKLLHKKGVIDSKFKLKSRTELSKQGLPLDITVRITGKDEPTGFYMFRDRFSELALTQEELYSIAEIKNYMLTMIGFVQGRIGNVGGLVIHTSINYENIINLLFDLGFIPKEFAGKTTYFPEEATVQAIKLFKEKNIGSFISRNFGNVTVINLEEEPIFINIGKETGLF